MRPLRRSIASSTEAEALKLERLRFEARIGLEALDAGDYVEVDGVGLRALAEEIKTEGRSRASRPDGHPETCVNGLCRG